MKGRPRTFDWGLMNELLREGKTPEEVSKELNVTLPTIRYAMRKGAIKNAIVSTVVFEKGRESTSLHLDTVAQLNKINEQTLSILDILYKAVQGDQTAIELLNKDDKFRRRDPIELIVKLIERVEKQHDLQKNLFETLFSA